MSLLKNRHSRKKFIKPEYNLLYPSKPSNDEYNIDILLHTNDVNKIYNGALYYATLEKWDITLQLLTKAVKIGHKDSIYYLGCCYESGHGVAADKERALTLFTTGSSLGQAQCIRKLGEYSHDENDANEYFIKAANGGDCDAMIHLVDYYSELYENNKDPETKKLCISYIEQIINKHNHASIRKHYVEMLSKFGK